MRERLVILPSERQAESSSRRRFVRSGLWAGAILIHGGLLEATPDIPETEPNIEGPFYKAGAPERRVLIEKDLRGTPLTLTGRVLNAHGKPLAGAILDLWLADSGGGYDSSGSRLGGEVRADGTGRHNPQTIVPRHSRAGTQIRPAHIHFKVSAEGTPVLTTQLYLAGDPYLDKDQWVRKSLTISPEAARGGKAAQFDFVLRAG
jgi:protocatechuate 3,4-dioxygenase beta subunit